MKKAKKQILEKNKTDRQDEQNLPHRSFHLRCVTKYVQHIPKTCLKSMAATNERQQLNEIGLTVMVQQQLGQSHKG